MMSINLLNNFLTRIFTEKETLFILMHLSTPKLISMLAISSLLVLSSCKKEPGEGGLATIQGKLYAYEYNNYGDVIDSGYVAGERVYISYGNDGNADDDVRTSYDGSFQFEWLQKGEYAVWSISRCDSCPLSQTYTKQVITIDERRETVTTPDLIINI